MSASPYQFGTKSVETGVLQHALYDHDPRFDPKGFDDIMGKDTRDAVQAAQGYLGIDPADGVVRIDLLVELGLAAPPKPLPNPLDNPLLRFGLQLIISRIFPGKDFPVGSILTTIESAWASKINWTQVVGVIASIAVYFGIPIGDGEKAALIGVIQGVQALVTWYLKTYRSTSITPAAAAKITAQQ